MRHRFGLAALLCLTLTAPLFAQVTYTITPAQGPVAGGSVVTIKGAFGTWPYGVIFGSAAVPATVVDATTLVATTPAHLPGPVPVTIFEYDIGIPTGLTFTFKGDAEDAFERMLLPVYIAPIQGAFGSEFRTDFRARLVGGGNLAIHGLRYPCIVTCIQRPDDPYVLSPASPEANESNTEATGTPGAFLYVAKDRIRDVAMNLRAYDTSRAGENFGTEIPVVRHEEFAREHPLGLVGIPTDARFRNTLRIYSVGPGGAVEVKIDGASVHAEHFLMLPEQPDLMHPGYIEFTNFPMNAGTVRVTLTGREPATSPPSPGPVFWAFVSVTNNETQHITTVTPQP